MASKTAIFKRVGIIKTLLCALTALILALALHSVALASDQNDENQLIYYYESQDSTDFPPFSKFSQTISTSTTWVAADTKFIFILKNLTSEDAELSLSLCWDNRAHCAFNGEYKTLLGDEEGVIQFSWTAADVQNYLLNYNWATSIQRQMLVVADKKIHTFGSNNPNSYPVGEFYRDLAATSTDANVKDAYFSIYTTWFPPNPPPYEVPPEMPTATSTELVITCDPESGFFQYSFCYLFQYLFSPRQQDFNQFSDLKTALENKPPTGYFVIIKNALIGLGATSTPAFVLENASSTLATPIYNPIKNGIKFLLWLVFGFWIFNRIRHFELG